MNPALERALGRRDFVAQLALASLCLSFGCKPKATKDPSATAAATDLFSDLKKRIHKHVDDKARRREAVAVIGRAQKDFLGLQEVSKNWRIANDKARDAKEEDMAPIIAEYHEQFMNVLRTLPKYAIELRSHVTESEWARVFPTPTV